VENQSLSYVMHTVGGGWFAHTDGTAEHNASEVLFPQEIGIKISYLVSQPRRKR